MSNRLVQAQVRKLKKIFPAFILVSIAVLLVFGNFSCEQSHNGLQGRDITKMTDTESEAFQIIGQALADSDPLVRINAIEVVATTRQLNFMPRVQQLLQDTLQDMKRFLDLHFLRLIQM